MERAEFRKFGGAGLKHVAVCLFFSFFRIPQHEKRIGEACEAAGLSVSLSSEVLPEFREYERASTTVINASLRPTVEKYLGELKKGLEDFPPLPSGEGWGEGGLEKASGSSEQLEIPPHPALCRGDRGEHEAFLELRIMHSGGGTLSVADARKDAAKLVLSGPAGGLIGATHVALAAGFRRCHYLWRQWAARATRCSRRCRSMADRSGRHPAPWTGFRSPSRRSSIFMHRWRRGGGSIAYPRRRGAQCGSLARGRRSGARSQRATGRGGDAADGDRRKPRTWKNSCRIALPAVMTMRVDPELARRAIAPLAEQMEKTVIEAARLGITGAGGGEQHVARDPSSEQPEGA